MANTKLLLFIKPIGLVLFYTQFSIIIANMYERNNTMKAPCIREIIEQRESTLSKYATISCASKGRTIKEAKDPTRTSFMVDRDRIIHSYSFRRLKDKAQVFLMTKDAHMMNRLSHTLEVAQVSRTIAKALNLNEDLTESIALAHDLAHTPFAHPGEEALNSIHPEGFDHEKFLERRVNVLDNLNLSFEVLNGAMNHGGFSNNPKASTLEGQIVSFADKTCYLTSDMGNALEQGIISDIPAHVKSGLGKTKGQIINTIVTDIINQSLDNQKIQISQEVLEKTLAFRSFMYKNVYYSDYCRYQAEKAIKIIHEIYRFLQQNPCSIPPHYDSSNVNDRIVDYISSLTDNACMDLFKSIFVIE